LLTLHETGEGETKPKGGKGKHAPSDQMLTLHGPPLLTRAMNACRHFMARSHCLFFYYSFLITGHIELNQHTIRPGLNIQTFEFGEEQVAEPWRMQDENINVEAIPLHPHITNASHLVAEQDLPLEKAILHHHFVRSLLPPKPAKRKRGSDSDTSERTPFKPYQPPLSDMTQKALDAYLRQQQSSERSFPPQSQNAGKEPVALTYYIQGPTKPGKFDAAMAKALGVFGPNRSKLVRGQTITLENGEKVAPHQVIGKEEPGAVSISNFFLYFYVSIAFLLKHGMI